MDINILVFVIYPYYNNIIYANKTLFVKCSFMPPLSNAMLRLPLQKKGGGGLALPSSTPWGSDAHVKYHS